MTALCGFFKSTNELESERGTASAAKQGQPQGSSAGGSSDSKGEDVAPVAKSSRAGLVYWLSKRTPTNYNMVILD